MLLTCFEFTWDNYVANISNKSFKDVNHSKSKLLTKAMLNTLWQQYEERNGSITWTRPAAKHPSNLHGTYLVERPRFYCRREHSDL
jgi:hypothetical protein